MESLFPFAPAVQQSLPLSGVHATVSACQIQALSGVLEIKDTAGATLALFLSKGKLLKAYALAAGAPGLIEPDQITGHLTGEAVTLRILSLPPDVVRETLALFEWHPPVQTTPLTGAVQGQLEALNARPVSSLAHLVWPDAEAIVTLPGNNRFPKQALFMHGGEATYETEALQAIYAQPPAGGSVACYEKHVDLNEWHEQTARLKAVFPALIDPVLGRYTDLAGSGIVTSLRHDLNDLAKANQWQFVAAPDGFTDTQAFETPEAAARAYSVLTKAILTHMSAIIGGRLANTILREAAQQFAPAQYELIRSYHLVSETVLSGKAR